MFSLEFSLSCLFICLGAMSVHFRFEKVFNSYNLYCFHTCPNQNDVPTSSSLAKKRTRRTPDRMARTPPTIWTPVFSLKIGIMDTTCEMIIWTCTTRGWLWHLIGQHWVFPVSLASPSSTNKDLVESSYSLSIFSVMYWDFITTFTFPSNSNKTWARPRVLEEAWPRWSGGNRDTWEWKLTILTFNQS